MLHKTKLIVRITQYPLNLNPLVYSFKMRSHLFTTWLKSIFPPYFNRTNKLTNSTLHSPICTSPPPQMLPYASLQEAETAIGRSLTAAEALWFNYTSNTSDYVLYCYNILFLFIIFTTVPLFYVLTELMFRDYVAPYKIQPKVKFSLNDYFKCYSDVMRMFILVVGPLQLVSYPSIRMIGVRTSLPLPSFMEVISQLVVYFLIEDYTNYWIHRLFHSKWGYEKIHKVHHEYTAPIGFAAPYAHWAEVLILGIPSFLGPAIVPGHMITFWLWIALRQIEAIETHSGYDFPWTLTKYIPFYGGADYHDYHHYVGGQSQSNFASVFTYCDYIYGTDKGYRYHKRLLQQLRDDSKSNGGSNVSRPDIKME